VFQPFTWMFTAAEVRVMHEAYILHDENFQQARGYLAGRYDQDSTIGAFAFPGPTARVR
jgi:hypothetical protein